jgi:hypothetical protein
MSNSSSMTDEELNSEHDKLVLLLKCIVDEKACRTRGETTRDSLMVVLNAHSNVFTVSFFVYIVLIL